jgi:hypothetical protein
MEIPIVCTLTPGLAAARLEEWRYFLAHSTGAVEKAGDLELRVKLDGSPSTLEAAAGLARREKACCGFFEFAIEVEADSFWLSVRVPPDAADTLEGFMSLLPAPPY